MRHHGPPKSAWTWPAKVGVLVAAWCFCCATADWVAGHYWWAIFLGALAVVNVLGAARLVRTNVDWQEAHQRHLEHLGAARD